ncbi:MAG: flagellar basal-body MS-ring/collar protein FliF [Gammaproteobacteria bacterium]|nr:flagellar basal-body MS-ring/collar protein FliF [Gammaproteobacteria bacterium]
MADLPVEVPKTSILARAADTSENPLESNFLMGFARLPVVRQLGLLISLAASVAVGVSFVLWMRDPEYQVLEGVSPAQRSQVSNILQANNIPWHIDQSSGMLMVPQNRVHEARMQMAAGGAVVDGSRKGCEILFEEQSFGTSQRIEKARIIRCLEGELARSIETFNIVLKARVLLAMPKPTVFIRDHPTPTASVNLVLMGGPQSMTIDQVRAVMNLVAGAVPELLMNDVTVVDQTGNTLSRKAQDPGLEQSEANQRLIRNFEASKKEKIANLLVPIIGSNHFRAEVSAEMDFTFVEETQEMFNPDLPSTRSELLIEERRGEIELAQGVPGGLSNQPPGITQVPETAGAAVAPGRAAATGQRTRRETRKNYELDRSISHTRYPVGTISLMTVSVAVDHVAEVDEQSGETTYVPREQAELEQLTALVKDAIGYNSARGDTVTLINYPFVQIPIEISEPMPFWMMPWFIDIVKQLLGGLALLILIMGLLRPLIRNVKEVGAEVKANRALVSNAAAASLAGGDGSAQLAGGSTGALSAPRYGPRMEEVQGLIAEDPARVAQVVKRWATSDE